MEQRKVQLRKLLKKGQTEREEKIESPLAKYNNVGQLICVVCKTIIKSSSLWAPHCKSKKHLENLQIAKQTLQEKKRKREEDSFKKPEPVKKQKIELEDQPTEIKISGDSKESQEKTPVTAKPIANASVGSATTVASAQPHAIKSTTISAPASVTTSNPNKTPETDPNLSVKDGSLPEGFFDDKRKDAEARSVIYVPPPDIEEEYKKFQEVIKKDVEAYDEELTNEIDPDGEEYQMILEYEIATHLEQSNTLVQKLEELKSKSKILLSGRGRLNDSTLQVSKQPTLKIHKPEGEEDNDEVEDEDVDLESFGEFDWRAKSYK